MTRSYRASASSGMSLESSISSSSSWVDFSRMKDISCQESSLAMTCWGTGSRLSLKPAHLVGGARAEARQQLVAHDLRVEAVTADAHARGAHHVRPAVRLASSRGPQPHQRQVRGAGAEVGHQHQLVPGELRLVGERRGDGLDEELDVGEARELRGPAQALLGERVRLGVRGEDGRAAEHDTLGSPAHVGAAASRTRRNSSATSSSMSQVRS